MDLIFASIFFVIFILTLKLFNKPRNLPPGPISIPVLGSIFLIRKFLTKRPHLLLHEEAKKYGDVMSFRIGSQLIVVVSGFDMMHDALVKQADTFSDRPTELPTFKQFFKDTKAGNGRGILFNNYCPAWRSLRRFTLQALRDFGVGKTSIEEKIFTEVDAVAKEFEKSRGEPVIISNYMQKLVGNVIYGIVFGKRYEFDDPELNKINQILDTIFSGSGPVNLDNFFPKYLLKFINKEDIQANLTRERAFSNMKEYIITQIDNHEDTYDDGNIRDFVDIYIHNNHNSEDAKHKYTKEDMFRVIMDLFIAGSETTSTNLDWAFLFLSEHQEVQEKCQREIQEVMGEKPVLYADRGKLPYIEATIMEILRLGNILPVSVFHSTTTDTTLGGFHIPKRAMIIPSLYSVAIDPRYWTEPSKFRPERFIDSSGKLIRNDSFIPFSTGPRQCLGEPLAKMELFLVTANLLQRFNFRRENETVRHSFRSQENRVTNVPLPYCVRVVPRA